MTSIIKFTALSGAQNEEPNCYLLQVDEFTFLLDCGWDEWFSDGIIKKIKRYLSQIDAILLSFPDPQHLGCLPYLVGKVGLTCPIYATVPIYKMGQMFMYDLYQSHHNTEEFDKFTLDDVDMAFDRITQLKHNQTLTLKDKGHGLSITPIHAAHIIGGTSWKIVKADEEGEIVYAVDFNHKRERHLNGCTLLESVGSGGNGGRGGIAGSVCPPQLLITDAYNASYQQARRKLRDEELLTKIIETMRSDGNVLIAVDTAGRVLELAILLDQLWRDTRSGLHAYSLAMLNNVTYNVVEFAKSMMEWMSEKIINSFTDQRNSPFQFKHLKLCHNLGDLAQVPHPKCVLASTTDMESGFSRQLFIRWCSDPRNSVIVTGRTAKGTLARTLIDDPTVSSLNLEIRKRVPIVGEELDEYEKKRSARKAIERKTLQDESSDESDVEETKGSAVKHDLLISADSSKKSGGFFKQAKKTFPMYPYVENRIKWDEYGEVINPDDFKTLEMTGNEDESHEVDKTQEKETKEEILEEDDTEVPTKCICEVRTLEVKCSVTYIDFEGRSDGESMLKIIQQIKPREVILVRGTPSNTTRLAETIRRTLGGDISAPGLAPLAPSPDAVQVFTPAVDEVVDTTKERHIYQVKLKDSLVNTLRFFKTKDAEVCWLNAKLDFMEAAMNSMEVLSALQIKESQGEQQSIRRYSHDNYEDEELSEEKKFKMDVDQDQVDKIVDRANADNVNITPTLTSLHPDELESHGTYFVNDVRLSDFKQILIKEGISAEFIGGVLVCNNSVAIRRNQQGLVDMEGCLSDDYYRIRELLYAQYAIL
ncbi:cleavage and polyadenylation specificity factor subunit 2-like isoform X2 [Styela clava]